MEFEDAFIEEEEDREVKRSKISGGFLNRSNGNLPKSYSNIASTQPINIKN